MSVLSEIGLILFKILIGVVLCEAVTEIFVASKILQKPRDLVKGVPWLKLLHDLITCGYCTSVWMGGGAAYLLKVQVTCTLEVSGPLAHLGRFQPLVFGFVMHRLSNWLHEHFSAKQKLGEAQVFRTWYPDGQPVGQPTPPASDPNPPQDGAEKKA